MAGQNIVVMADQFPSNYYCWKVLADDNNAKINAVPWPENGDWTESILAAIDKETAVVSIFKVYKRGIKVCLDFGL